MNNHRVESIRPHQKVFRNESDTSLYSLICGVESYSHSGVEGAGEQPRAA